MQESSTSKALRDAERFYSTIRIRIRDRLQRVLRDDGFDVRVAPINSDAITAWLHDWFGIARPEDAYNGIDWSGVLAKYRELRRVDVALWHGERLCGLIFARFNKTQVMLEFIETCPGKHALSGKMMVIADLALAITAQEVDLNWLVLNRLDVRLVPYCERLDYKVTAGEPSDGSSVTMKRRRE